MKRSLLKGVLLAAVLAVGGLYGHQWFYTKELLVRLGGRVNV